MLKNLLILFISIIISTIIYYNNDNKKTINKNEKIIEIWSKSSIGKYFWESIIMGRIDRIINDNSDNYLYSEGYKIINFNDKMIKLHFRTGPSLKPESYRLFHPENLILILNWRNNNKINYSIKWINVISNEINSKLKNLAIIALGNELCNNEWFINFYNNNSIIKKFLRFIYLTYDAKIIDNKFYYQWPIGIASYRNFPLINNQDDIDNLIKLPRKYLCNFLATIYPNSTRQELLNFFKNNNNDNYNCIIKTRNKWPTNESNKSMNEYVDALKSSELTICPAGKNVECYRIIEAIEYGSIPIIEINSNIDNNCDQLNKLRLFQLNDAPFIYIQNNWTIELPRILKNFQNLNQQQRIEKRIKLFK